MQFTIVIPARFASTRLPGKPLIDISGKPMIEWVWLRAIDSKASRVVVATDDQRILKVCRDIGAEAYLTSENHPSGTDRIAEVATILELNDDHVIVNLQGDEPLVPVNVCPVLIAFNKKNVPSMLVEKVSLGLLKLTLG